MTRSGVAAFALAVVMAGCAGPMAGRLADKPFNVVETGVPELQKALAEGRITEYEFEQVTLKIANGCRYTPDWVAYAHISTAPTSRLRALEFYEIKARKMIWDDAIVKLKVAATKYPYFKFYLCAWGKSGWIIQEVRA